MLAGLNGHLFAVLRSCLHMGTYIADRKRAHVAVSWRRAAMAEI